ncbi:MAG TPA: nuclear transport factor 2 family protein [Tetrasphaera sp.]|nr:nuclear transport factor 2 family protein [Tetrasphaera sp.]
MDAAERRAIEHDCAALVMRYANGNDAADWDLVARLFAADGRMSRPTAPDDFIEGRDAILAAFRARPARTTRHVTSNVVIGVESATSARGECALVLYTAYKAPIVGSFHDRFVRTSDGWRFAERRGSLTFAAETGAPA